MEGPRRATVSEYNELMALINRIFRPHSREAELLESLVHHLFRRRRIESLSFSCAVSSHYIPLLLKISDTYSIRPIGMIRLINLQSTLKKLTPFLRRRASRMGVKGKLTLGIKDGGEEVNLTFGRRKPHYRIRLERRAMCRLLFGPLEANDSIKPLKTSPIIEALFPVPLYISPLNCV
ncbi:hypothetical protein KAU86_01110 [bacterium]|nr:hypothetical protein [bacterium]